jgi:hypothetical protein
VARVLNFQSRGMRNWGKWLLSTRTPEQWKAAEERGRELTKELESEGHTTEPPKATQPRLPPSWHHRPGEGDDLS